MDSYDKIKTTHAALGSIAWVFFFPLGSILIRLLHGPNAVWIHSGIQLFALLLVIINTGLGIYMALETEQLNEYHPIIGLVLFSVLFFQAAGGYIHHLQYKKHQRRTAVSHVHIWLGRAIITLGMINGGLGLQLAADGERSEYVAYGVIAGLIWVAWMAVDVYATVRSRSRHSTLRDKELEHHKAGAEIVEHK